MTANRDAFWRTLVDFVADHADPETASCRNTPNQCPLQDDMHTRTLALIDGEDISDLIDWMIGHVLREGAAIAHTRRDDGEIGLTGFAFDSSRTAGMLAGMLLMGRSQGQHELDTAARTILRFAPPATSRAVFSELLEQLVGSLVERHQQMRGAKADA